MALVHRLLSQEDLAALTGREVADLVVSRTLERRRRQESAELLERAMPTTEKYKKDQWLMSLR